MTTEHKAELNSAQTNSAQVPPVKRSQAELRADATRARAELASTLDAIEYKLNLPKQVRIRTRRMTMGIRKLGEENPAALAGIALGAVAVLAGAIWLGVKALRRR